MTDGFKSTWTPLVGERAAAVLWRSELLSSALGGCALLLAAAASVGLNHSLPLGLALVTLVALCLWLRIGERKKIARALSDHFGTPITWRQLPPLRAERFKSSCDKRGWSATR